MPAAGDIVRAADQPDGESLAVIGDIVYTRKPAEESVTSSTSVQNDDDLTWALAAGNYRLEIYLHVNAAEAADIKVAHTFSGTAVVARSCFGPTLAMTDRQDTNAIFRGVTFTDEQSYGIDATGSTVVYEDLAVEVSVAGTWNVRWAQVASSGTATTLSIASRAYLTRLPS